MVNRTAYRSVLLHGGYGYMEEYRICRLDRDAACLAVQAGAEDLFLEAY